MFNYIFPTIDLNFNSAGSQFIKSQLSLKLVNIIKQTVSIKVDYYLQSQQLLILFFTPRLMHFCMHVGRRLISRSSSITRPPILFILIPSISSVRGYQQWRVEKTLQIGCRRKCEGKGGGGARAWEVRGLWWMNKSDLHVLSGPVSRQCAMLCVSWEPLLTLSHISQITQRVPKWSGYRSLHSG